MFAVETQANSCSPLQNVFHFMKRKKKQKYLVFQIHKPRSLKNHGFNCYINAACQAISSCNILFQELMCLQIDYSSKKLKCLCSLLKKLVDNSIKLSKNEILDLTKEEIILPWSRSGQQDSFEFLTSIFNAVYNEIQETNKEKSDGKSSFDIKLPMRLHMAQEIKCSRDHVSRCPAQCHFAIHASFPPYKSRTHTFTLQSLVDWSLNSSGAVDDYICEQCQYLRTTERLVVDSNNTQYSVLTAPLPNTLMVHLQRTQWNPRSGMIKLNLPIIVDYKLRVSIGDKDQKEGEFRIVSNVSYYLKAFIVHSGSVRYGHYTCYKQDLDHNWFLTNDEVVRAIPACDVLKRAVHGYIFFYEIMA